MFDGLIHQLIGLSKLDRSDREAAPSDREAVREDREASPVSIVIVGGQHSTREALRDFERAGLGTFL